VQHSNALVMEMTLLSRGDSLAELLQCSEGDSYRPQEKERKMLRSNNQPAETATAVVVLPLDTVSKWRLCCCTTKTSSVHTKQATVDMYKHSNKNQLAGGDSSGSSIGNSTASGDNDSNGKKE